MNVYLFERGHNITPLQMQKNNREFEVIVQECIMNTIRDSIPTEDIIRAYTDESVEIEEEVVIENIEEEVPVPSKEGTSTGEGTSKEESKNDLDALVEKALKEETASAPPSVVPAIQNVDSEPVLTKLSFNDIDHILDTDTGVVEEVSAPKDIDRLEEISMSRAIQRKIDEAEEEGEDHIKIMEDSDIALGDIFDINGSESKLAEDLVLDGIEEL